MPTVLVIDDDGDLLAALQRAHAAAAPGWDLVALVDSREALALLADGEVSLVVTDILMPEVEGLELLRAIRREHPKLPVLAMTGEAQRLGGARLDAARALGAREVLEKPFEFAALETAVARHLA